jgi:hypothetical protein
MNGEKGMDQADKNVALSALVRKNLIEKLTSRGIKETQDGTSIHELSHKALVREVVIATYRDRDIDSPDNSWF